MDRGPALAELQVVGNLLRQRVPERVHRLGVQLLLEHELPLDQFVEGVLERRGLQRRHSSQDRLRELLADHRCRLQDGLLPGGEPVDPGGKDRLHARRHPVPATRPDEPVRAALAFETALSTSESTTSSMKNGLPPVRSHTRSPMPLSDGSEPSRSASS